MNKRRWVETRFCIAWYEQYGFKEAPFGEADVLLSKIPRLMGWKYRYPFYTKGSSSMWRTWFKWIHQKMTRTQFGWSPTISSIHWKMAKKSCSNFSGEQWRNRSSQRFVYRLFHRRRKGWTDEGVAYNSLIMSWPAIQEKMIQLINKQGEVQKSLF